MLTMAADRTGQFLEDTVFKFTYAEEFYELFDIGEFLVSFSFRPGHTEPVQFRMCISHTIIDLYTILQHNVYMYVYVYMSLALGARCSILMQQNGMCDLGLT